MFLKVSQILTFLTFQMVQCFTHWKCQVFRGGTGFKQTTILRAGCGAELARSGPVNQYYMYIYIYIWYVYGNEKKRFWIYLIWKMLDFDIPIITFIYPPQNYTIAPKNRPGPKNNFIFQPPFFRGELLVFGGAAWKDENVHPDNLFHLFLAIRRLWPFWDSSVAFFKV